MALCVTRGLSRAAELGTGGGRVNDVATVSGV